MIESNKEECYGVVDIVKEYGGGWGNLLCIVLMKVVKYLNIKNLI